MELSQVGISLASLYEKFGENLKHCKVIKTEGTEKQKESHHLFFHGNEIACYEGEICEVLHYHNEEGAFLLQSKTVKKEPSFFNSVFILTDEEFNVAFMS